MTDLTLYHNPRCSKSRGALELLEARGLTPTVVRYLDTPLDAAQIEALLKKLGISARQLLRTGEDEYKTLNLADEVNKVFDFFEAWAEEKEVTLRFTGNACWVNGDPLMLRRAISNLLSNALRACSAGGKVRLMLRRSESFWQLTVMDNGCGLPEAGEDAWLENRRCFLGGAKLGLLLCRECCRRMGWGLRVERAPEKGTQAVVTIPLCTDRITEPTVELHTGGDTAQAQQHQYQLRNMLVRELRTMPERGDPDEL